MLIACAALIFMAGAIVAILAHRFPNNAPQLYRWSGRLLLTGSLLAVLAFPILI